MSLNGLTLNSAALNGAAILVLIYATASSSAEAAGSPIATKIQHANVWADALVVITVTPEHTQLAKSNASASAYGDADTIGTYAGACAGISNTLGTAYCLNTIPGFVTGSAGAEGYAIPANLLAGFGDFPLVISSVEGIAEATKIQHAAVLAASSVTGIGSLDRIHNGMVNATLESTGYADWQYLASGASTWVFDGHAWPTATAVGSVDETKYKIEIGNGFIATAESSASINPYRIQAARANVTFGATGSTAAKRTTKGTTIAVCGAEANIVGIRQCLTTLLASAGSSYSQTSRKVLQTHAGKLGAAATTTASAIGTRQQPGRFQAAGLMVGVATGTLYKMAEVDASATVVVTMALAFSNFHVPAPESRSMTVPQEDRAMVVFYEDRIMRMAA